MPSELNGYRSRESMAIDRMRLDAQTRKVLASCIFETSSSTFIRGVVQRVKCNCGVPRWNDGTRCSTCGNYYQRHHDMALDQEL